MVACEAFELLVTYVFWHLCD